MSRWIKQQGFIFLPEKSPKRDSLPRLFLIAASPIGFFLALMPTTKTINGLVSFSIFFPENCIFVILIISPYVGIGMGPVRCCSCNT
jgi:hypothetical protein